MADTGEDVRNLFLDCVNLLRNDISVEARAAIEASREEIEQLLATLARLIARRDPTKRWFTRADAPGYLLRHVMGAEIRVPLYLFDDVPSDDVVDELLGLAASIRTDKGTICLSGSCAVYGTLQTIADCDFCEYLQGTDVDVIRTAVEAAAQTASPDVIPLKIAGWGSETWVVLRPWPKPVVTDDRASTTRALMAHYFGRTKFAGDVEVTKIMIPIGNSGDDGRSSSFPAQELPLAIDGWLPRTLVEPPEIGTYVVFLRDQIEKHRASNVAKALQRGFSLARVLFLADFADEIASLFRKTPLLIRGASKARAEYAQRLATQYGSDVPAGICDRALASAIELFRRAADAADAAIPDGGTNAAGTLLERLIRSVDAMLPAAYTRFTER